MPEKPPSRKDHGDPLLVGSNDNLRLPGRPARLHDGPDSRVGRGVYAVPEREEGVQREWQPVTSRLASAAFLMASSEASTRLT